jgi:hypothetical protein
MLGDNCIKFKVHNKILNLNYWVLIFYSLYPESEQKKISSQHLFLFKIQYFSESYQ